MAQVTTKNSPSDAVRVNDWTIDRIRSNPLLSIPPIPGLTQCDVWAQCELFAPTGSHKDHMYMEVLRSLERQGRLHPGMAVIDYSSGNGGAALAYTAALLGYKAIIVRPAGMSPGKAAQITAFGGWLVETPAHQGIDGAVAGAQRLAKALGARACFVDQGEQDHNLLACRALGEQIVGRLVDQGQSIDVFVCAMGTGGTFSGIAGALKDYFRDVQCIAVDIEGETAYAHRFAAHRLSSSGQPLEGVSTGIVFGQAKAELIDRIVIVSPDEAYDACRTLWRSAHLFAGPTSGANVSAISKLGIRDARVLTVFFDAAWKYLDDDRLLQRSLRDGRTSLATALAFLRLGEQGPRLPEEVAR